MTTENNKKEMKTTKDYDKRFKEAIMDMKTEDNSQSKLLDLHLRQYKYDLLVDFIKELEEEVPSGFELDEFYCFLKEYKFIREFIN